MIDIYLLSVILKQLYKVAVVFSCYFGGGGFCGFGGGGFVCFFNE